MPRLVALQETPDLAGRVSVSKLQTDDGKEAHFVVSETNAFGVTQITMSAEQAERLALQLLRAVYTTTADEARDQGDRPHLVAVSGAE